MSRLALFLFGSPRIELDGTPVKVSRHKAMALMAYLAITTEIQSRNTLATLFWPNYDQSRARAALRRTLVTLNKTGIGNWLEIDRETIGLKNTANLWVDVQQFHRLLATCLAAGEEADTVCLPLLTEAVALYHADFMAGFTLRDSPDFDAWQLAQAENLRYDLTSALARLIRCYIAQNDFEPAISCAQRWVKIDPLYELAHRQLMQLYAWNNQRSAALRQYQTCARILKQELGILPAAETTALYKRFQHGEEASISLETSKMLSPSLPVTTALHNFPAQPTPFIGRKSELTEIINRLNNPDCKLLTLTGPGGIGKTRLAIKAAIEQSQEFADGLYFVSLVSVTSPDILVYTLADSLNLSLEGQTTPYPQLLNYLRNKNLLLVIDNFEHLTQEIELLLDILGQAPNIKILVTSRARLNLQGEWTFAVGRMNYPPNSQVHEIETYSAVALFLNRAYRIDSGFSLTEADKPHIVRICQLVEGIPLGIELAATWIRVLSCQEIAREIEKMYTPQHNLDFLATSLQDIPKRHQSLRLVFEHSWNLLSSEEQRVFKQLSVFHGVCSRVAIEAVTGATLFLISALVDKSLLTRNTPKRYEMHEVLRQYATEKLGRSPQETQEARDRHCEYYATFLQKQEFLLRGDKQKEILAEIAGEIENIRAYWHWAVSQQKITEIKKGLESLWYFYAMYGWFQEGAETFGGAVVEAQALDDPQRDRQDNILNGQILAKQGWYYLRQGHYDRARALLQQSITIFEQLDDEENIAAPLLYLGVLTGEIGNAAESKHLLQKSLTIYRKTNNQWGIAWALSHLAYRIGEMDDTQQAEAKQLVQKSLLIYKNIGNKHGIAIALNNLGYIAYLQADYKTAKGLMLESLVLRREVGYPRGIAVALNNLGHITAAVADYKVCKSYYYEGLKLAADIQAIPLMLAAVGGLAVPFSAEQKMEQALELLLFVLDQPASNKETRDRAADFLTTLKSSIPAEIFNAIQTQVKENPRPLEAIVADILVYYR